MLLFFLPLLSLLCLLPATLTLNPLTLSPVSQCLSSCNSCPVQPHLCSGRQLFQCDHGYSGNGCQLMPNIGRLVVLLNQSIGEGKQGWRGGVPGVCRNGQEQVQVRQGREMEVEAGVRARGRGNFILLFNLVRGLERKGVDVVLLDEGDEELVRYRVDKGGNQSEGVGSSALMCGEESKIVEKYEIQGIIESAAQKVLKIRFQADPGSEFGITNVRLLLGCGHFLVYSQGSCQTCHSGYYPIHSQPGSISGCRPCAQGCLQCQSASQCLTCEPEHTLSSGKCVYTLSSMSSITAMPTPNLSCPQQLLIGSGSLKFELQTPAEATQVRLVFRIAYTPSEFSAMDNVVVLINGREEVAVLGVELGDVGVPVTYCEGFGREGLYALYAVRSGWVQGGRVGVELVVSDGQTVGVGPVQVSYQRKSPTQTKESTAVLPLSPSTSTSLLPLIDTLLSLQPYVYHTVTTTPSKLILHLHFPIALPVHPYMHFSLASTGQYLLPVQALQYPTRHQYHFQPYQSITNQIIRVDLSQVPMLRGGRRVLTDNNGTERKLTQVNIMRYDIMEQHTMRTVTNLGQFMQVITWCIIICLLILTLFNLAHPLCHCLPVLQLLFLHTYILAQWLPLNYKHSIGSLYRLSTMDFFAPSSRQALQNWLLGNVWQHMPSRLVAFGGDGNFVRAVCVAVVALGLYGLGWGAVALGAWMSARAGAGGSWGELRVRVGAVLEGIRGRAWAYWHSAFKPMFVVFLWAAFTQLHNLSYPADSNRSPVPNAIFCFVCLLAFLAAPPLLYRHLLRQHSLLPTPDYHHLYAAASPYPNSTPTIYYLLQYSRYVLSMVWINFLGGYGIAAFVMLILTNIAHMLYVGYMDVGEEQVIRKLRLVQDGLMVAVEALGVVVCAGAGRMGAGGYLGLGWAMVGFSLGVVGAVLGELGWRAREAVRAARRGQQVKQFQPAAATQRAF